MAPTALPQITEADFALFQRIIPELQNTSYDEWADEHRRAVAYRTPRNGSTDVPVSPHAFEEWLRSTQQPAHLELLWVYAEDIVAAA